MKFDTIKEACQLWVERDMNQVPMSVVEKLQMQSDYNDIVEITPPSRGDRISVFSGDYGGEHGEIVRHVDGDEYAVQLDSDEYPDPVTVSSDEFDAEYDSGLPMWGTMWSFGNSADDYWLEEKDGLELMAECGFRIYEQEDFGYLFGIDGAGYSFMEAHWIPLYKARGLRWHREEEPAPKGGGLVQKILEGR